MKEENAPSEILKQKQNIPLLTLEIKRILRKRDRINKTFM